MQTSTRNPFETHFYRPQTKFAKVIILHLSVSHSVHRGVCLSACLDTPQDQVPPREQTPPPRRRHHPFQDRRPSLGSDTPQNRHPWEQTPPLGSACWEMRSTSRRYTSYWNAILYIRKLIQNTYCKCTHPNCTKHQFKLNGGYFLRK